MIADLPEEGARRANQAWWARLADARRLPEQGREYSAVITSPPYPNRHDYTRVFGVELMFGFLDWQQTRKLRYQSFHSHPEARPARPRGHSYPARIFGEVPENADDTWTHGALVGGMGGYDDRELADSYFLAADALVERVLADRDSMRTRELVAPTMYLYRHGIELFLKLIVRPTKPNHSLDRRLGRLRRLVRIRYKEELPAAIADAIVEFCRYDPHAVIFRFATDKKGRQARGKFESGEVWIDLHVAKAKMARVRYGLRRCLVAEEMGGQIPPRGAGDLRHPLATPPHHWLYAERLRDRD